MVWSYVVDAKNFAVSQVSTTLGNIKDSTQQTYDVARGDDEFNDISRRQVLESTGALFLGYETAKEVPDAASDVAEESPVGFRWPFTLKDGSGLSDQSSDDADSANGGKDLDYSQEMCEVHAELDDDVQRDIEDYLSLVSDVEDTSIEEIEVEGETMYPRSERIASARITGTQGNQDQFGATTEYAEILEDSYNEDTEEFYDGLNSILEGECS